MAIAARIAAALIMLGVATPAGAGGPDWSRPQPLTVIAADYRFSPERLVLRHGVVYRLQLKNRGKETHEFHAAEFFKAAQLHDLAPLNADRTEIVLQPGDAKDVEFIAPPAGRYPLSCPDHDWAGMTGQIVVK